MDALDITPETREDLMEARECVDMICQRASKAPWDEWARMKALELRHAAEELLGHVKAVMK